MNKKHLLIPALVIALAGCGGGGGGGGGGELVKWEPLPEFEVDTVVVGTVLEWLPGGPMQRYQYSCSGTLCAEEGAQGEPEEWDVDLSEDPPAVRKGTETVRNGISMALLSGEDEEDPEFSDPDAWSGWGEYQVFFGGVVELVGGGEAPEDIEAPEDKDEEAATFVVRVLIPFSFGTSTGQNPAAGTATWSGAMLGTRYTAMVTGADVVGDARLEVDFAASNLDVTFSNIRERGTDRGLRPMEWTDLPMADGLFVGTGIEGRFYGPEGQEAGGVFDRRNILGAFGMKREQ